MSPSPYKKGDFVWCNFPYREAPANPGPMAHVGYVQSVDSTTDPANPTMLVAYTTTSSSQMRDGEGQTGCIHITGKAAKGLGQNDFMLDMRRLAFLPARQSFFPELGTSRMNGVIGRASSNLQKHIEETLKAAVSEDPKAITVHGRKPVAPAKVDDAADGPAVNANEQAATRPAAPARPILRMPRKP
jgi:hypothetical protein